MTAVNEEEAPMGRSSHGVSVIQGNLVVMGGESVARTPIDSEIHYLPLKDEKPAWATVQVNGD